MPTCPSDNADSVDQSTFWDSNGVNWFGLLLCGIWTVTHILPFTGWVIAGSFSVATVLITMVSVTRHAINYRVRDEQRQIIRIMYMPPVYAIISFFSYRFFRSYTYYELAEVVYESMTLAAFLLLLIQYVAASGTGHSAEAALTRKDKRPLPLPLCMFRFRPTKPAFMHVIKWSVLQYTVLRPAISVAGVICQKYNVLCNESWSPKYASVWLTAVDCASISSVSFVPFVSGFQMLTFSSSDPVTLLDQSIALYGLILFYVLTREELKGRRPLAKFLTIKLIVMVTFYQSFIFDALQTYHVIHATQYWTATNIADGLSALALCIEMVFFAIAMMWAYPVSEYKDAAKPKLGFWRAIIDSINFSDFAVEVYISLRFFVDYMRGKPGTHSKDLKRTDFDSAFRLKNSVSPNGDGDSPFIPPYQAPQSQSTFQSQQPPYRQGTGTGPGNYSYPTTAHPQSQSQRGYQSQQQQQQPYDARYDNSGSVESGNGYSYEMNGMRGSSQGHGSGRGGYQ